MSIVDRLSVGLSAERRLFCCGYEMAKKEKIENKTAADNENVIDFKFLYVRRTTQPQKTGLVNNVKNI